MKKYTDLLIDIDGTITDTREVERIALKNIFDDYKITITESDIELFSKINENLWLGFEKGEITKKSLRLKRFKIFLNQLKLNLDADIISQNYFTLYSKTVVPFKDAVETIKKLSNKYRLHIISNGSVDVQYYKLEKLGIKDEFENVFLSEEIGYAKPDKRFFENVYYNISQENKSETLVIGDSLTADIIGGKEFGFDTLWISKSKDEHADYITDEFYKVKTFL